MKNVFLKKNKLKDLIYIQENKPCSKQTVEGLFRSLVEPILEENEESIVFCRLEPKNQLTFNGLLKRLEYSKAEVFDFSDVKINDKFENILSEKIWDKTEFVYVLTERFGAVLIFDYDECEIENFASIYILQNSKRLLDTFNVINANSTKDLTELNDKFHPDRRENDTLNKSIRKIVGILNESNQEVLISEMGKENLEEKEDLFAKIQFLSEKSRFVTHEIRNQLSICNLYSTIIKKRISKLEIEDESVKESIDNAVKCIIKSLKITDNCLVDLKSLNNAELKNCDLKTLIDSAINLSGVYIEDKTIEISSQVANGINIVVDENKFLAVIVNLIKNAVESIEKTGIINIIGNDSEDVVSLRISNDGKPIDKVLQGHIFEEGFTTKKTGSGLGLYICRKSLEEQFAQLKLNKSDEKLTEFEILLPKTNGER